MFHVGDVIRKLRRERKWKVEELASHAKVAKMTVSAIERGANYRADKLDRIATALGTTSATLLAAAERDPTAASSQPPPGRALNEVTAEERWFLEDVLRDLTPEKRELVIEVALGYLPAHVRTTRPGAAASPDDQGGETTTPARVPGGTRRG